MTGRVCAIGFVAIICAGCGPGNQALHGEVAYGGEPVQDGIIEFIPIEGTKEPSCGAAIVAGRYEIRQEVGPFIGGTYKVAIWATKKTGKMSPDPMDPTKQVEERANFIPADYNINTTLKCTISSNTCDFKLERQKP
jgi:hypothetical protein